MKAKSVIPIALVGFFALFYFYDTTRTGSATRVLYNGVVYTLNEKQPVVEAVAIAGDRILAVGSSEELLSTYTDAPATNLRGKAVYPGFTDAHGHLENLGIVAVNINLLGTTSVEQIKERIAARVAQAPPGSWIYGRAWDQNRWPDKSFPTHHMLDAVASEHPVSLERVDGHALWVNKKALDLAGITRDTPDPPGGRIVRDREGNPTGVLIDNATALIDSVVPPPSKAERTEAIQRAVQECLRVGLTQMHDMGADMETIAIYRDLIREKKFPFRVYAAIDGVGRTWDFYRRRGPERDESEHKLTVRALKLYADGALGSRGAALIEPYADDPGNRGLTLTSTDVLTQACTEALEAGFQVCTHAIGDRGNHIVLNVYENVLGSGHVLDPRFRVEHAQVLDPHDIPRFARLGVLPSMQPTHCTSDMYWAEGRIGPKRIAGAYAWRSLLDAGSIIPGGSDFPVESPNPLLGFYAAITRQDTEQWPEGGWYPEQRMTRIEALKAFTMWAAYAAFEESLRGTIEAGKLADLVVLSNDIMKCEPREIPGTTVLYTIVGGEIAYAAEQPVP